MPQRSPIILWLLLAATICVDAIAAHHVAEGAYYESNLVLQALIYGDLTVVCIWSGLSREKSIWTRSASWSAAVAAIAVLTIAIAHAHISQFWEALVWTLPQTILHAAMLLMFLWLLERTPFWQRHTGVAAKWRFSLGQLLTVTTVVAVLTTWFRNNYNFYMDGLLITLAPIGGRALLGLGSAISWSLPLHWLLRFALAVALAILLGVGCALTVWGPYNYQEHIAYFLIQAIVLSLWLGLAPILPTSTTPAPARIDANEIQASESVVRS